MNVEPFDPQLRLALRRCFERDYLERDTKNFGHLFRQFIVRAKLIARATESSSDNLLTK